MVSRLATLSLLLAGLAGSELAHADLVLPGRKKVRRETTIDFGPYKEFAPWSYAVKPGDTLTGLAKTHLGSPRRHSQILTMNDGLTADSLRAGQTIVMPPKSPDTSKWMHFFAVLWDSGVERAYHGQPLPHHHYGTSLWAVPHEKMAEFTSRLETEPRKKRATIEELRKASWVATSKEKLCGYASLPDRNPVNSIRETYVIESIEKATIELTAAKVEKIDGSGKRVAGSILLTRENGLSMLLAALGAGALVALTRRRP